jgi:hypothetical protein
MSSKAAEFPDPDFSSETSFQSTVPDETEHLLKVAASVARDATNTWADLWAEFKPYVTSAGLVGPDLEKGFVPQCGWTEFLERLWLLKHYMDSITRVCHKKH